MQEKLLGIDIGGSKIIIVLYQGKKILKKWRENGASLESLKRGLFLFPKLKAGIALPGIVDVKKRKILKCSNLPFLEGLDLKKELKRDFILENDAKCFVLAERKFGALKGKKNGLGIIFGTGIGGAFVCNRELYFGSHFSAGEFGQIILNEGKTWEKLYQERKDQKIVNTFGIANLINIFDPEIVVLAGGGGKDFDKELLKKFILSPLTKKEVKVVPSSLGEEVVSLGASLLFNLKFS